MRAVSFRFLVVATAMLALLAGAEIAGAKAKRVPSRQVLLTALAGPRTSVDQAAIVVTDADGRVVARSRTANAGAAQFIVGQGRAPYTITTTGGTVRGHAFKGHLQLVTSRLGGPSGIQYASFATTVAAQYQAAYGGSTAAIERRVYTALGLNPTSGWLQLKYGTHGVRGHRLLRAARRAGGYDALVADAVARLHSGRPQQSFASPHRDGSFASSTRAAVRQSYTASTVASAPCQAQVLPQPSSTMPATVGIYSTYMVAGTVSAFATKDPSLLLNGVAGMVFGYTPGMTNSSMLRSITAQLSCISQQIAQLQNTLNNLKLDTILAPLKACTSAVNTAWSTYQQYIQNAANNPGNATYALSTSNPSLAYFMGTTVPAMYNTSCAGGGLINSTLFSTSGGAESGWQTYLSNFKSGTYNSADKAALTQSSVEELEYFLQYYGVIEYEMAALQTDYFNWQQLLNPGQSYLESQQIGWGSYCAKAPSLTDLQSFTDIASWCQMQQNIVDVWPNGIYTDEAGAWKLGGTNGVINANEIDGVAISAVPAAYGVNTTGWKQTERLVTPSYLHGQSLSAVANITNAMTSYNNQPQQPLTPPYETWNRTQGPKTIMPTASQMSGFNLLGTYYSYWLNASVSTQTTTVNGQSTTQTIATPTPNTQQWQLLGSDAKMTMSSNSCSPPSTYADWPTRTVSGALFSPSHWDGNKLGGESWTSSSSKVCDGIPPIAWMLGRTWTQGGSWPSAPTITTSGTVAANATLTATGCPTSGCTWTITDGAPSGLTIGSTTGTLAWTGSAPGTTATIQVVALNAQMFSAPVSLTVQLS